MLGLIGEWALMQSENAVNVNYWGPSSLTFALPSGNACTLIQETAYPLDNKVSLRINPRVSEEFALALRIPNWSQETIVTLNGERIGGVAPGRYLTLSRRWQAGDMLEITFDFRLHFWAHEALASIYRGPLLLAFDHRYNETDSEHLPALDAGKLPARVVTQDLTHEPWLLLECSDAQSKPLYLCDFASAGMTGNPYRTWFEVHGVSEAAFTRNNPLRSHKPDLYSGPII
jgi:DUF1680 family protein